MKNMEKEETHRYNSSLSTPPLSPGLTFPSPTSVLTSREEIRHRLSLVGRKAPKPKACLNIPGI